MIGVVMVIMMTLSSLILTRMNIIVIVMTIIINVMISMKIMRIMGLSKW